ncbi:MAG: Mrp/NBP35 family ATP-binding protein [Candidatus Limnocylindrales bacterium]
MPTLTEAAVLEALRTVQEPELGGDLISRGMVKDVRLDGTAVGLTVDLTTPACPLKDEIENRIRTALLPIGAESITVDWAATVRRATPQSAQGLPGVKNVIAVASGKGGVGKSTVAANLAVALALEGAAVGLLDADITGPNIPLMLGIEGAPSSSADNKISPLERYGVKVISIAFFVPDGQPIVWRGPLIGGAIQQFLRDVAWGELDYLVVDLPPGTSDAQLTLAQAVPLGGALLVTTPQDVALSDVEKAYGMFRRMSVPIIGIVENMGAFVCAHCGEVTELFGRGGGERFAQRHEIDYFGSIPLDVKVRQGGDAGVPAVAQREPGPAADVLRALARTVAARMSVRAARQQPVLSVS